MWCEGSEFSRSTCEAAVAKRLVHGVVKTSRAEVAAHVACQVRARVACVGTGVRMRGRDVGR